MTGGGTAPWLGRVGPQVLFSLVDAREIIAQLQADPALLAEVRAVVLAEDLLAVPARLDRIESHLASLVGAVDQLRATVEEQARQIASSLGARTDQLAATVSDHERILVGLSGLMERLIDQSERVEGRLGRIEVTLDGNGMRLARIEQRFV